MEYTGGDEDELRCGPVVDEAGLAIKSRMANFINFRQ